MLQLKQLRLLILSVALVLAEEIPENKELKNVIQKDITLDGCGGVVKDVPEGTIDYPGNGRNYKNNQKCNWEITLQEGDRMEVNFLRFSTANNKDKLLVINGKTFSVVGTYYGKKSLPPPFITDSNQLHLRFTSDARITQKGFKLTWKKINVTVNQCEGRSGDNSLLWQRVDSAEDSIKMTINEGNYNVTDNVDKAMQKLTDENSKTEVELNALKSLLDNLDKAIQKLTDDNSKTELQLNSKLDFLISLLAKTTVPTTTVATTTVPTTTVDTTTVPTTKVTTTEEPTTELPIKDLCRRYDGVLIEGQCLIVSDDALNWDNAAGACSSKFGRLAVLKDNPIGVNAHLHTTYGVEMFWAGGSDTANEGSWIWEDGEPFDHFPWSAGQPDNGKGNNQDCLVANFHRGFDDDYCSSTKRYICELVDTTTAPPSTTTTTHMTSAPPTTPGCSEAQGFFMSEGSTQCFKIFKDTTRTWDEANTKCRSEGLRLAEPIDAVAVRLRSDIVDNYGENSLVWLGARGDGSSSHRWLSDGRRITLEHPLMWPGDKRPSNSSGYCLNLLSSTWHINKNPNHVYYFGHECDCGRFTLCELV